MNTPTAIAPHTVPTSGEPTQRNQTLIAVIGLPIVVALAFLVFGAHLLLQHSPKIVLVFDSSGYLFTTNRCLQIFTPDFLGRVSAYVVHGFPEAERMILARMAASTNHLLRCGPVMPVILGTVYGIAHKQAVCQYWQTGAAAMILIQALTVGTIFHIARIARGLKAAIIAVAISLLYAPFTINAPRLLSEMPAALALVVWVALTFKYAEQFRSSSRPSGGNSARRAMISVGQLAHGCIYGIALVCFMLARSIFLPIPPVVLAGIWILSKRSGAPLTIPRAFIVGMLASVILTLSPWVLYEKVMTGHASIAVDRFGAYNLFTGCNVETDGLDVVQSGYVEHPNLFNAKPVEAARMAIETAVRTPLDAVSLALRKPARLMDTPWNDFQTKFWFMDWSWQVWFHQFIVVLGVYGLFQSIDQSLRNKSYRDSIVPLTLGMLLLYNFINCFFITMRRYLFPVFPALILLSAFALTDVNNARTRLWKVLLLGSLIPSTLLALDLAARNRMLQTAASIFGLETVSLVLPLLVVLSVICTFVGLARCASFEPAIRKTWWVTSCIVAICSYVGVASDLNRLDYEMPLASSAPITVPLPERSDTTTGKRVFLLLDCYEAKAQPEPFRSLEIFVDGKKLPGLLHPLMQMDASQRGNFEYLRVFAASGGVEPQTYRQWWCIEVPAACLPKKADHAQVRFINKDANAKLFLYADFLRHGACQHRLSTRLCSWTKGFCVNSPGEMRMDEWIPTSTIAPNSAHLIPRLSTLVVAEAPDDVAGTGGAMRDPDVAGMLESGVAGRGGAMREPDVAGMRESGVAGRGGAMRRPLLTLQAHPSVSIDLPDAAIGFGTQKRLVSYEIPSTRFSDCLSSFDRSGAVRIQVSGEVRGQRGPGPASAFLFERCTTDAGGKREVVAPTSPLEINATTQWQQFEYEDLLPLILPETNTRAKLGNLRLLLAGNNWWDALQYCEYKPKAPLEFRNLKVKLSPTSLIDLNRQKWRTLPAVGGM